MVIHTALKKIAEEEGMIDPLVENPLDSAKGQGYLGDITAVRIKENFKNHEDAVLNLVIKCAATNDKLRESSSVAQVFGREVVMYKSIFPAYYTFEKEKGIVNPFTSVAKCYYGFTAHKPEFLILENLFDSGFRAWNRQLQMEDTHVRMVLSEYGQFHATSFAMRDQKPELFQKLTEGLNDNFASFLKKSGIFNSFVSKAKKAQESLYPKADVKVLRKYGTFLDGIEEVFQRMLCSHEKSDVILHGDSWCNNMMFKYEDSNNPKRPTAVRLLDFQFSRLGPPVCDLVYFFYSSSSQEVMEKFNIYQRVYHESLSTHLKKLGTNPEKVYPFTVFEEEWRKYAKFGLIVSSLTNYARLSKEDELIDFTTVVESGDCLSNAFNYEIANITQFNERMKYIIENCVENNFI